MRTGQNRRSFGSIANLGKDGDGLTRWRLRYTEDGKRKTEMVHGTKRDAEHRLSELHVRAGARRQNLMTLDRAADEWFWPRMEGKAQGTVNLYRRVWEREVSPAFGKRAVSSIKPLEIQRFMDTLPGAVAKKARSLMKQVIDQCVMFGVVDANPMSLRYSMPGSESDDKGVWDLDGLHAVWDAVVGSIVEAPVLLMAFGGLRVGEALGMRSECVREVKSSGVTVAACAVEMQVTRDGPTERLKTPQSRRTAVVPGPMGARLVGIASSSEDGWLAGDGLGGPMQQYVLSKEVDRLLAASGVERHPLRNFRNSWETVQHWTLGMDPTIIEPLMGHAGNSVTAKHYDRPLSSMLVDAVAAAYAANPYADSWGVKDI